jgi:DNA-binding transcriptional ArsR family regulator
MIERFENWLKLDEQAQIDILVEALEMHLQVGHYDKDTIRDIVKSFSFMQRKFFYAALYNIMWNLESLQTQIKIFRRQTLLSLAKFEDLIAPPTAVSLQPSEEGLDEESRYTRLLHQEIGKELSESKERLFHLINGERTIAELAEALDVTPSYVSQVISEWEGEGLVIKERQGRRVIPVKTPKYSNNR